MKVICEQHVIIYVDDMTHHQPDELTFAREQFGIDR